MSLNNKTNQRKNTKGSSIVELIIVTILFAILVPISFNIFISASKINGQAYIQHSAAVTLGETNDIMRFMRNQGFDVLVNGAFYLIRNPGSDSWLVKSDLPDKDAFERYITVSNAQRHEDTNEIYMEGDVGAYYEDENTKKIQIQILWAPDYLPLDLITHTMYITNWQNTYTYL